VFALPAFRHVLASDRQRFVICLVLALFPIGNGALSRSITWVFWPMLLASTLLCAVPGPQKSSALAARGVYLGFNACSSPLASLLVPVYVIDAIRGRRSAERIWCVSLTLTSVLYVVLIVNLSGGGDLSEVGRRLLPAYGDRVVFEGLFSNAIRMRVIWYGTHAASIAIGLGALALLVVLSARDRGCRRAIVRHGRFFAVCGYVSLALTLSCLYVRFSGPSAQDYGAYFHHRYFWVQQYLFLLCGSVLLAHSYWLKKQSHRLRVAFTVCLASYLAVTSLLDRREYTFSAGDGVATKEFLNQLDFYETHPELDPQLPIRLVPQEPEWTVEIWKIR
jgi:hypothetical protein